MQNKIINILKNPKTYTSLIFIFLIIQPIVDLDYLLNDFLKQYHLLVPSTVIRFLGLPVLAIIGFLFIDKNKDKTFKTTLIVGTVLVIYSLLHFKTMRTLDINLPDTFRRDLKIELKYILMLILPFVLMYCVYLARFTTTTFNKIIIITSFIICSIIFITDLFSVSFSSYGEEPRLTFILVYRWI